MRIEVGDVVEVLSAFRLPKVKEVIHVGSVLRVEERGDLPTLYWISGLAVARTLPVLRLRSESAAMENIPEFGSEEEPHKTLAEWQAEEGGERWDYTPRDERES